MRSQALASNVANLDTPDYQRAEVRFEEVLQARRRTTPSLRGPETTEPTLEVGEGPPLLEDELMSLADTQMRTQLTTRALQDYFDLLRTGILGRSA